MKSARITTKAKKKVDSSSNCSVSLPTVVKKSSYKTSAKTSAQTQLNRIKEALQEVELIESGSIKPISLKEALDGL